jgi:hypothetical protein
MAVTYFLLVDNKRKQRQWHISDAVPDLNIFSLAHSDPTSSLQSLEVEAPSSLQDISAGAVGAAAGGGSERKTTASEKAEWAIGQARDAGRFLRLRLRLRCVDSRLRARRILVAA